MTNTWLNWPDQQLVAEQIYNFFTNKKLDHYASSSLVTMAEGESSFRHDALGDKGKDGVAQAFGLYQIHWHPRGEAIFGGCRVDLRTFPPVGDQLQAIWWELNNPEHHALLMINTGQLPDPKTPGALLPRDAYTAGYMATRYYERPGAPGQAEKRGQRTIFWSDYFTNLEKANANI